MFRHTLVAAALTLLLLSAPALAQAPMPGDPEAGRALAEDWCAECHEVGPATDTREPSLLPRFADVADDRAMTELAFRVFLQTPHGGMPNFRVDAEQAGDLYAYLITLRRER